MSNEGLKEIARRVNDILTRFIELHDRRLKEAGTLRSFLGNFFDKRIDFVRINTEAILLGGTMGVVISDLEKIDGDSNLNNVLFRYSSKLNDSIVIFCQLTNLQKQQSQGSKVTWKEYKALENKYKESIIAYHVLGQELNDAFDDV